MNLYYEGIQVMDELYGKDVPMPLATVNNGRANVRVIDAFYKEKAFYITTYALSSKMKEIEKNPHVALNHNLFVAHGIGKNLGHPLEDKNKELREDLRRVFYQFYDKHVDEQDKNTCILKVELEDALLFANDAKYSINFINETAKKEKYIVDIQF